MKSAERLQRSNMKLETLLEHRKEWQRNTIKKIQKKLLYKPEMVAMDKQTQDEKLVVLYGPPQIGKTTLIFQLLGIQEQYQKELYDLLRAGVARGNSSTSTAIIYQKCTGEKFGVRYEESVSDISGEIEYVDGAILKSRLVELRELVEKNQARKDILCIYIPKKFFINGSEKYNNINILDLPGDGSRNVKEKEHVKSILIKYMSIATVNILVCKANEIQSLESLELPTKVNWRNLSHKYMIVITNAYGQGTVKKYFEQKREERGEDFYQFVKKIYHNNMKKILGEFLEIEYFPIDMGDSLACLLEGRTCEEDRKEISKTAEKIKEEVRSAIQKRSGNSLKSMILDLKEHSSAYAKDKLSQLKDDISDIENEIATLEQKQKNTENHLENYRKSMANLQEFHEKYEKISKLEMNFESDLNNCEIHLHEIIQNIYQKNGKIVDKGENLLEELKYDLIEFTGKSLREYRTDLELPADEKIYGMLWYENEARSTLEGYYGRGWFAKKIPCWEYEENVKRVCEKYKEQLIQYINERKKEEISKLKNDETDYLRCKYYLIDWCEKMQVQNLEKYKNKKHELDEKMKEQRVLEENIESDKKLLENYSKIANEEYHAYIGQMKMQYCKKDTLISDKVNLLIYMALLEKDYQSIMGEI